MNKIAFKSKIRPVTLHEFHRSTSTMNRNQFVDYPWTLKESKHSVKAYTTGIQNCTVCGITDGLKVLLLHICPTMKKNQDFNKIKEYITQKVDLEDPYIQGFLLGSNNFAGSSEFFNKFVRFFKEKNIPFTMLKGGEGVRNVAYSSNTDEWLICGDKISWKEKENITPQEVLQRGFDQVIISDLDETSW